MIFSIPVTELFIICVPILIILIAMEYCWRKKLLSTEMTRKIIHATTGIIIAFLPFAVSYRVIQFLAVGLLMIILLSYKMQLFKAIHSVKRVTIGEILYPVGIGVCAFIEPAPWIFTAAILHLALADSVAALAGQKWGKRTRYKIITHGKSLVGSMAFFYTSMAIMLGAYLQVDATNLPEPIVLLVVFPLALTLLENISLLGSDDVTIPVAVILLLGNASLI